MSGEITLKYNIVLSGPDWRVEIIFTLIEQCDRTHCWPMKSVSVGLEQKRQFYTTNKKTAVNRYVILLLTVGLVCQQNLLIKRRTT